jgi:Sulfatase
VARTNLDTDSGGAVTFPRPSKWGRAVRPFLPGLAVTGVLALVCNAVLEVPGLVDVSGRSHPWSYKTPAFVGLFLLGTLVVWCVVGLVHAVVGRIRVTAALALTGTALVAVAGYQKVRLRQEPLYPADWAFAGDIGFLAEVVGPRVVVLLVLAVLALGGAGFAATGALLRRLSLRGRGMREPVTTRARLLVRALAGGLCLVSLGYLSQFNSPGNAARGAYEALGASWMPWSQERNYLGNGFVGGFLYNLQVPAMTKPPGYSATAMDRITDRYTRAAERINRTRDPDALDDLNVVTVLSESFSDPTDLEGVHVQEDPIPFTRRLARSTVSGRMLAQNVGGGTANMEFEALTGMSMSQFSPQLVPYQMLVPEHRTFPSAVGWFEQQGHRTVAVHPFTTEMYRRREVYPTFGFDEFVWGTRMRPRTFIQDNPYISDAAAFAEVRRRIGAEQHPLFLHLVTMQNHIPYPEKYDDAPPVTDPEGTPMPDIEQYVRGLTYSDQAMRDLVTDLQRSDERTVLVFFGDHLPGVYPPSVLRANTRRAMRETPFLVWANFPGPEERQPTTSPIHFMDLLLERADAAVPPFYALLHEMRQEVPAMDSGMVVDASDRLVGRAQLSPRATRLLRDYRMVQYDLSVGERHTAEAMFTTPPPS